MQSTPQQLYHHQHTTVQQKHVVTAERRSQIQLSTQLSTQLSLTLGVDTTDVVDGGAQGRLLPSSAGLYNPPALPQRARTAPLFPLGPPTTTTQHKAAASSSK